MKRLLITALLIAFACGPAAATTYPGLDPLLAAQDWINGPATAADIAGKVVLVDVFSFDCINCKHVTPGLKKLRESLSSAPFEVIGIHSPETPFERNRANVVSDLSQEGIVWPVAVDNSMTLWKTYGADAWPTVFIFDKHGRMRAKIVGEGQDALIYSTVHKLLDES